MIDFERVRADLDTAIDYKSGAQGGRRPLGLVMMFKVFLPQAPYELSDLKAEFQILDQWSFERFLRLDDGDEVPDETTIGHYREALTHSDTIKTRFDRFDASLKNNGDCHGWANCGGNHRADPETADDG